MSIDFELEILSLNKKSSLTKNNSDYKKNVFLNWDITDNDIIELSRALYATHKGSKNGKRAKFIDIERQLELFFGKKVKRPHNKVTRIGERIDISPFLDMLKKSYIKEFESRL